MGFLTRSIVPYHVRHPARSAVHNADRRRRASNRKASKGFWESVAAAGDEPQQLVINDDEVGRWWGEKFNEVSKSNDGPPIHLTACGPDPSDPWALIARGQAIEDGVAHVLSTRIRINPNGTWTVEETTVTEEK